MGDWRRIEGGAHTLMRKQYLDTKVGWGVSKRYVHQRTYRVCFVLGIMGYFSTMVSVWEDRFVVGWDIYMWSI